jgi:hypothetical protein
MLEAIKSCLVEYDGELIQVTRGRTRVAPDHPIAKARPDAFRRAIGSRSNDAGRERVYASGLGEEFAAVPSELQPQPAPVTSAQIKEMWARRGGPSLKPPRYRLASRTTTRLSEARSPFAIRLAPIAKASLISDLRSAMADGELEAGAALFGRRPASWQGYVDISDVATISPQATRQSTSFYRDPDHDATEAIRIRRQSGGSVVECGFWHCHPSGGPLPSDLIR